MSRLRDVRRASSSAQGDELHSGRTLFTERIRSLARLHVNVFQPVQRLVSKHRDGARVRRVYDRAQTPYQSERDRCQDLPTRYFK